jgi:hypothetical protein
VPPRILELLSRYDFYLPTTIVGALIASAIYFVGRAAQRAQQSRLPRFPYCRRCRYPAFGLPTTTCPECGSDLRGRGTVQPRNDKPKRMIGGLRRPLGWTLLVAVWWPAALILLGPDAPRWEERRMTRKLHGGTAGLGLNVYFLDIRTAGLHPLPLGATQMYLEVWHGEGDPPRHGAQRMMIDPRTMGYGYWNSRGERVDRRSGFNRDVLLDLYQAMGVSPGMPAAQKLADDTIQEIQASRYLSFKPDPRSRAALISASVVWWMGWLIVLLVGEWRRRRRRPKHASRVEQDPVLAEPAA